LGIVNIVDIVDVVDIAMGIVDIGTDIADIGTDIADIGTDIVDVVNIADIADRMLWWKQVGAYKVLWRCPMTDFNF
jgi:hypothetical protein